jgi:hypothetical protein
VAQSPPRFVACELLKGPGAGSRVEAAVCCPLRRHCHVVRWGAAATPRLRADSGGLTDLGNADLSQGLGVRGFAWGDGNCG